ncbi:probable glutamate receptor [Scylla paramamosain]|uniref:probable glutamate receptor n=1 Tax=Scylla paramamosain TaxID=85552 RepID=UPI003082A52F
MFKAAMNGSRLSQVVTRARQVRVASWMVVVVVVSDDPVFLAAFAQQTREGRLLVWATRLIVVSRRTLHRLHPLHQTLALTNSLLLLVDGAVGVSSAAGWVVLPYQRPGVAPLRVASWTAGGNLSLHRPLFWDKFSKFPEGSDVMVAMEENHSHLAVMEPDPKAPGGVRLQFEGFMINVLAYLAQGLNFSYTFRRPPDRAWGVKLRNGSFTGMVGQVHREDVNLGLGPFAINAARYEAGDFTWPINFMVVKVLGGRGSPEVDPWGFLLPFDPWVWAALFSFFLLLSVTSYFLSTVFSKKGSKKEDFATKNLHFIGIMFRQYPFHIPRWINASNSIPANVLLNHTASLGPTAMWVGEGGCWWQRVMLGVWMLMTMVLTRSYEGNLMSLLAVRHLPQPYQTLGDVVDDPSVVMVWEKQGAPMQAVIDATFGIFYEVKKKEEQGRLRVLQRIDYDSILDEVIRQHKVIIDYDLVTTGTISKHFSRTGRCDLYVGHGNILAQPIALMSQKDSPLIPALNERITSMSEAGLYYNWAKVANSNSTSCERVPIKITISSTLSIRQCSAMLMVLAGGLVVGLAVLCLEVVVASVLGTDGVIS